MKKRSPVAVALLCSLALALSASAADRAAQWKAVDEAMKKGLPKTAVKELEPIIQGALADKAYAEAVKAIGRKIALEGNIQGNKPEEKIFRMQEELDKAPEPMKPLMEAVLAHWYWHYFQQNRWRFMQRTQTAAEPGPDIQTWDLPRILAEIGKHFDAALADPRILQTQPISDYDALVEKGTMPDRYRPTLFDFIAYQALQFYQAGEQAGSKAQDAFEMDASSPVLGPIAGFLKWEPDTGDTESATLKALRLYQQLLRFHQGDKDPTAFLDADLQRLAFGYDRAVGEGKAERYKAALKAFVGEWADHELSASARWQWARVLHGEGDLVEARKIALQGAKAFPDSMGGRQCYNLVQQIEARESRIATERVWNAPWPTVDVTYRNVTKAFFRAVPWDYEDLLKRGNWNPESVDDTMRKALLAAKPVAAWSADLPPTTDYQRRTEPVGAPKDLAPGFYFVLASHDRNFAEANDNLVSVAGVWVSQLALVGRVRQGAGEIGGLVADALTGEPIEGATVVPWTRAGNRGARTPGPTVTTDADGLFHLPTVARANGLRFFVRKGDQALVSQDYGVYSRGPQRPREQTIFFTDRSLYRPGQTVKYKGICIHYEQDKDNYRVLGGQDLVVVFQDVNGKEIERQRHKTNAYGSFSGSFNTPRDRLTGRMTLRVQDGPRGGAQVSVEEYKRPKFQVALEAPKEEAKLGARVQTGGKATAYTGAAIGGAKVAWRVTRGVEYPIWWRWACWWWPPSGGEVQEIAHGTSETGPDGRFTFDFTARPDRSIAESSEPTFVFTLYADVTDTTGETRSDTRTIRVGYTALQAAMSANDWQQADKPVEVTVRTTTLDGDGRAADGTVKIYVLKQPKAVARPPLTGRPAPYLRRLRATDATATPEPDPANPNSWALGSVAAEQKFATDAGGTQKLSLDLKAGIYRAVLETRDRFGKPVSALLPITVLDVRAKQFPVRIPNEVASPTWTLQPGDNLLALWGTGYGQGRAYVEIEHRGKLLKAFWTEAGRTQEVVEYPVDESMRGGFTFRVTYVRENRAYVEQRKVDVPWTNKQLDLKWEHFVSKLKPGAEETWTAVITGPDAEPAVAEMVAALYDASLDAYLPHDWMHGFNVFRQDHSNLRSQFENRALGFGRILGGWRRDTKSVNITYRHFPNELVANLWGYGFFGGGPGRASMRRMALAGAKTAMADGMAMAEAAALPAQAMMLKRNGEARQAGMATADAQGGGGEIPPPAPDLSKVSARKNLQETAFFFPQLVSGADGKVRMQFTMPEALTEWKFLGFAHDRDLRSGYLTDKAVTAKDLMVEPNPPRFVREGDELEFTVKVSNQSAAAQRGTVRLSFADARTLAEENEALGLTKLDQNFDIPSKESKTFSWRIRVPDGMGFLTYKAVGSTGRLSDGEEGYLPVLSRRVLVTESLPLPIRGKQTKTFRFDKLADSAKSKTLQSQSLTVQMTSQPAWYAVMALPYLMEYPYECTEQTFNRLYANALARHIANGDPKIRRVFDQWKGTEALDSPLEKNEDLKAVALEETPWVRQAESESQARRNVGILFDANRLNDETKRLLAKLSDLQLSDGRWPWFPGGPANEYITLYIVTGFGRLRHLGVDRVDVGPAVKALDALDAWIDGTYRDIKNKDAYHLSPTIALYLYGRSFFLDDQPVADKYRKAVDYFLGQAKRYWLQLANRQSQAHLAVALKRFGDPETAKGIMTSIKERSVSNEEMGMFWRDTELSWWWYRAPIETQAMMIEAFDEVMNDAHAVEDCKVWLLKQKQTQDWKTTKATADAVYGLLVRGANLLSSDALVQVQLAGVPIQPVKVEAGTGFYEQRFPGPEVKPSMAEIKVIKTDEGVSWGSVHWQYLEDIGKVTPHEGTPLKLKKTLFVKKNTTKGPVLTAVKGPVEVGDELVVRIELRTDRDMEYVHMKDERGSGTEPVNVLSRYRYQDGLAYYESTKDTATHFFIDYLPKGIYVFEYSLRVQLRGNYQAGLASIQCLYAPEFNSHSESEALEVK